MGLLNLQMITGPVVEPVSLAQAKNQLRVDFPDDDALIVGLITAARVYAERAMRRAIFNQEWQRTLDFFPIWSGGTTVNPTDRGSWMYYSQYWNAVRIDLPGQVSSIVSISYLDPSSGQQVVLPASDYILDPTSIPGRIVPAQGMTWPVQELYAPGSVQILYVTGSYGDGVAKNACPQTIVQAILMLANHWYHHRSAVEDGQMKEVPLAVKALLDCHKMEAFEYQ
jgi:uncharacterized phiE125 gp8 family phage protein